MDRLNPDLMLGAGASHYQSPLPTNVAQQQALDTGAQDLQTKQYANQQTALDLRDAQMLSDAIKAQATPMATAATPAAPSSPATAPASPSAGYPVNSSGLIVRDPAAGQVAGPNDQVLPGMVGVAPNAPTSSPAAATPATTPAATPPATTGKAAALDWDAVSDQLARNGAQAKTIFGIKNMVLTNQSKLAEMAKNRADTESTLNKLQDDENDQFANMARQVQQSGYSVPVALSALRLMADSSPAYAAHAQQIAAALQANPDNLKTIIDSVASHSTAPMVTAQARATTAQTGADKQANEADKQVSDALLARRQNTSSQLSAAPDAGTYNGIVSQLPSAERALIPDFDDPDRQAKVLDYGLTPDQRAANALRAQEIAKFTTPTELAAMASDPTKTPEQRQMANDALKRMNQYQQAGRPVQQSVNLTPEAIQMYADSLRAGKPLPSFGRGGSAAIGTISNAAASQGPVDLASAGANYKSDSASLAANTKMLDNVTAFEGTALKNLKIFTDAAAKLPDTGVPWLNTPVRLLSKNLVGTENMAAVDAARSVGLREIARITNDPKMSAVLSDSARHEVMDLSPQNATLGQIRRVAQIVTQDVQNTHASLAAQHLAIQARIGKGGAAQNTAAPPVENWIRDANGKLVKQ